MRERFSASPLPQPKFEEVCSIRQGSEEWFDEFGGEYRAFLKRWHDIKENGDPVWRAEWKNGQPVLVMKEVQE